MNDEHVVALIAGLFVAADRINEEMYRTSRSAARDGGHWGDYRRATTDDVLTGARRLLAAAREAA